MKSISISPRPEPARRRRSPSGSTAGADPYRSDRKYPEPTVCPDCRAVHEKGRWRWREPLPGAAERLCPACRRIREEFADGDVTLSGPFLRAHRDEIMAVVRRVSDDARRRFPLQRLIRIAEDDAQTHIFTTSAHLARSLGRAVHAAFHGELAVDPAAQGRPRVRWLR